MPAPLHPVEIQFTGMDPRYVRAYLFIFLEMLTRISPRHALVSGILV